MSQAVEATSEIAQNTQQHGCAWAIQVDEVELFSRVEAYYNTRNQVKALYSCQKLKTSNLLARLPTELVDKIADQVVDAAYEEELVVHLRAQLHRVDLSNPSHILQTVDRRDVGKSTGFCWIADSPRVIVDDDYLDDFTCLLPSKQLRRYGTSGKAQRIINDFGVVPFFDLTKAYEYGLFPYCRFGTIYKALHPKKSGLIDGNHLHARSAVKFQVESFFSLAREYWKQAINSFLKQYTYQNASAGPHEHLVRFKGYLVLPVFKNGSHSTLEAGCTNTHLGETSEPPTETLDDEGLQKLKTALKKLRLDPIVEPVQISSEPHNAEHFVEPQPDQDEPNMMIHPQLRGVGQMDWIYIEEAFGKFEGMSMKESGLKRVIKKGRSPTM